MANHEGYSELPQHDSGRVRRETTELPLDIVQGEEEDHDFLVEQLDKARLLLAYAAENGIAVADATREAVLGGAHALQAGWTQEKADRILTALTTLAAKVQPVTARSLALKDDHAKRQVHIYTYVIWALGAILVPFSIFNFCVSRLSESIQADLRAAQPLADKLSAELYEGSEPDATVREPVKALAAGVTQASVIQDLSQFAFAIRAIAAHSAKLNVFIADLEREPWTGPRPDSLRQSPLELKVGLPSLVGEYQRSLEQYQKIRFFAQSVQTDASIFYGAVLNCLLPMLYAILGSLAYLLRTFEVQLRQRTFTAAEGHTARFAIAAIGGFVVGLFNVDVASDLLAPTPQPATISPLAIAFMVGYAADVFFSFLEALIQTFARRREPQPSAL